jgi:peptidoglycan hydrolase FlgJ
MDSKITNPNTDLTQRFALDVQGFDAMRAQAAASPQQSLKSVAKQFDAVFLQMMLKSMREATPQDGPLDSRDTAQFTSMLDEQLAQAFSAKGVGVADALVRQLSLNAGLTRGTGGGVGAGGAAAGGMLGALGDGSSADAGKAAMANALARAYSNAAANGALGKGSGGYSAASALTPPVSGGGSPSADAFVQKMAGPAQAASQATGIPARFIVGQAALETGWGKSEIKYANGAPSHNVFGIKATKDWTGKTVDSVTTEYVNGEPRKVVERFRAYDSYADAVTDYANILRSNPRYASVVNARDAASFANGMQRAGYATDPQYAKKLMSIMQQMG